MTIAAHIAKTTKNAHMTAQDVFESIMMFTDKISFSDKYNRVVHFTDGSLVMVNDCTNSFNAGISSRKYLVIPQDKSY